MQAHEMDVVIPEDHRLIVQVPDGVRAGPARMILLIPSAGETVAEEPPPPETRGRMAALYAQLAADPRSFRNLSPEERRARLRRVRGIGRDLLSTSEEFASRKREEIEIEERQDCHPLATRTHPRQRAPVPRQPADGAAAVGRANIDDNVRTPSCAT
ncbi:MAG: hypothetical protein GY835_10230 [bacterium]|nr:hypothetical protein [bacterium]